MVLVGVATSSERKFQGFKRLVGKKGIQCLHIEMPHGLSEPSIADPKTMAVAKLHQWRDPINQKINQLPPENLPDWVVVADVLGVGPFNKILKKPNNEAGLDAITKTFADWQELMSNDGCYSLSINYYFLQTLAKVSPRARKVESQRVKAAWDSLEIMFSVGLVKYLADPENVKQLAEKSPDLLTNQGLIGIRLEELIPAIIGLAGENQGDDLSLILRMASMGDDKQLVVMDSPKDLKTNQQLMNIIKMAVHTNMTLHLANQLADLIMD